jgi:hypothetical protein
MTNNDIINRLINIMHERVWVSNYWEYRDNVEEITNWLENLRTKDNIWHNGNEEQPDGKRRTVCYCLNTNGGEVGIHTIINPNYRWAYLEDLDPEYVECGNCVNDKGCIVCEHGEQKQTY